MQFISYFRIYGRLSNLISSFILHFHTFKIENSTPIIIWLYILYLLNISVENQKPLIEVRISELCDALSFKKWTCQSRDRRTWVYCFLKAFSCKNPFIKLCWSKATHCTYHVCSTQRKVDPEKIKNDSILKIVGWPSL